MFSSTSSPLKFQLFLWLQSILTGQAQGHSHFGLHARQGGDFQCYSLHHQASTGWVQNSLAPCVQTHRQIHYKHMGIKVRFIVAQSLGCFQSESSIRGLLAQLGLVH